MSPGPRRLPGPEHGVTYDFCLIHGILRGCRNPDRGDTSRGDLSRDCPMHGILAEEARANMAARREQAP